MVCDRSATTERLCSTISTVRFAATVLISAEMRAISSWPSPAIGSPGRSIPRSGAGGRTEELGQEIEHCRLAGAVRPDQRMDGAATDRQVDLAHGCEAAKLLGQTLGLENDVTQAGHPVSTTDAWPVVV